MHWYPFWRAQARPRGSQQKAALLPHRVPRTQSGISGGRQSALNAFVSSRNAFLSSSPPSARAWTILTSVHTSSTHLYGSSHSENPSSWRSQLSPRRRKRHGISRPTPAHFGSCACGMYPMYRYFSSSSPPSARAPWARANSNNSSADKS